MSRWPNGAAEEAARVEARSAEVRAALRDQRDTDIQVGQTVAYNLSGTVAQGKVTGIGAITDATRAACGYSRVRVGIEVTLAHPASGHPTGHVSYVRNAANLLVLDQPALARHRRGARPRHPGRPEARHHHPYRARMTFPPDQDLAPGDLSFTTVVEADRSANEARRIVQGVREAFGGPCDVILLAVPAGKGYAFVQGLGMAMEADGKLVHRHGPRVQP